LTGSDNTCQWLSKLATFKGLRRVRLNVLGISCFPRLTANDSKSLKRYVLTASATASAVWPPRLATFDCCAELGHSWFLDFLFNVRRRVQFCDITFPYG
jgi:hypothetical protein